MFPSFVCPAAAFPGLEIRCLSLGFVLALDLVLLYHQGLEFLGLGLMSMHCCSGNNDFVESLGCVLFWWAMRGGSCVCVSCFCNVLFYQLSEVVVLLLGVLDIVVCVPLFAVLSALSIVHHFLFLRGRALCVWFFFGLALGIGLMRLVGAAWFKSASSSMCRFRLHALFVFLCFWAFVIRLCFPGVVASSMLSRILDMFTFSGFCGHVKSAMYIGSLEVLDLLLSGLFCSIPQSRGIVSRNGITVPVLLRALFPSVWSGFSVWVVLSCIRFPCVSRPVFFRAIVHILVSPIWSVVYVRRSCIVVSGRMAGLLAFLEL